jgi:hypothetical protein
MRYDETNIYTLVTDVGELPPNHTNAFEVYGYVYPGQFYVPEFQDSVHLFLPWLALHFSSQMIQDSSEHNGVIEMPWPWGNSRYSLSGYGYKWIIKSNENNQIIQQIDIVRDSTLDLKTEEDELRRSMLEYPFSISSRESILKMLQFRKDVPDGFVRCSYKCLEVLHTNGLSIPSAIQFAEFWPVNGTARILYECTSKVDRVELLDNETILDAIPPVETSVFDFRYQATNSRTKFNYARYTLNAGDRFPSGRDPKLLAEAQDWLEHGLGYDSYKSKREVVLAGMLIITLIFTGLLLFRLNSTK